VTWERWAGAAGVAFVVLYIVAFSLGIEVGPTTARSAPTTPTAGTAGTRPWRSS
jgi:hypothetical protein